MRVVIDARLVTYQRAGIGTYLLSLLRSLRDIVGRDRLLVLVSRKDPSPGNWLPDVETHRVWTPPHHRLEQVALPIELMAVRGDVYHAPDFIPPFLRRTPAVITIHDLAFLKWPGLLTAQSRGFYGQTARAVRSAERIIAVSTRTRDDLVELVDAPARRIQVVYEAADARFKPVSRPAVEAVRTRLGLPEHYFLFVGTREPRKNLGRLIEAYASFGADAGSPHLVIAGRQGWLNDDLESQAAILGLRRRVHFTGGVADDDLPALYSGATAFVLPSIYEGFGLPALEAMACDTPVIASTGGSLPEIVGDAGLLVDPFDVAGLSNAMRLVWLERSLAEDLIGRGRERAAQFSWRRAAEETLDVYRRAA